MAQNKHLKCSISFSLIAILVGLVLYAPHYLVYTDNPLRSDVIILLLGPEYEAREKEVQGLLTDGYSNHLIIPAYGRILNGANSGALASQGPSIQKRLTKAEKRNHGYRFYEDTHLEVLHAKAMMDKFGFKSANFVSSPYHMRRIKLIAGGVFDGGDYDLSCVATPYEKTHKNLWWFNKYDLKWVVGEYLKIAWFLIYEPFT